MKLTDVLQRKICPLCGRDEAETSVPADVSLHAYVDCKRCRKFTISEQAIEALSQQNKYLLSAVCRNWTGDPGPKILTTNIDSLIEQAPRFGIAERMDALLNLVATKTTILGSRSSFYPLDDYPLLALQGRDETEFLLKALIDRGYIAGPPNLPTVTVEGWGRLEKLKQSGRTSTLAFVAMWFDKSVTPLYEKAIRPAIRNAGYEPMRIDRHEHVNRIDDEIIGQIRRSRFMVADFTGQRLGVYFEAGLMMGLGRNVIWMCRRDELNEDMLHFDVRQYNFIAWDTMEDAKTRIFNRILGIEGQGPLVQNATDA
jgi:hypothetical protein